MTNGPERTGVPISDLQLFFYAATAERKRPIAERFAPVNFLRLLSIQHGNHIRYKNSPFQDSRIGTRMNSSALEAFAGGRTQQMLDSFAWLRERYFDSIGGTPEGITDNHLWSLSLLGEALPAYLMLRAENPIDRMGLPEVVGNIYQTSLGLRKLSGYNIDRGQTHTYTSPREVYEIADSKNLFFESDPHSKQPDFSCVANEPLITKTADAVLFGNGADPQ